MALHRSVMLHGVQLHSIAVSTLSMQHSLQNYISPSLPPPPSLSLSLSLSLCWSPLPSLCLQECNNPCCNANTCQLASGAQCSSGTCCDLSSCQFRPYGTECRASSSSCDISEYCSGEVQDCPVDTHRRDGTTCNGGNDYCFDGACQTLNSQCQFHFGELGTVAKHWK